MILESIVTTADPAGSVNVAPMGPRVSSAEFERFVLRPFTSSQTYRNLIATGRAVVHITDDVLLFARAVVGDLQSEKLVHSVERGRFWPLRDCHRWFAVEVDSIGDDEPGLEQDHRVEISCRVYRTEIVRPFFGFNRAKHAVLEAAILASRTHLIEAEKIEDQLQQLSPLVEKTAGPAEREAFDLLCRSIRGSHAP